MPSTSRAANSSRGTPDALRAFLADPKNRRLSTAEYVARGVEHVTAKHLEQLQARLGGMQERIAQINDSPRLQQRLLELTRYLHETGEGAEAASPARREVAFALAYFFEGADRIPDSTPDYGLLDDALVVEAVLTRNEAALRTHANRVGRELPEQL